MEELNKEVFSNFKLWNCERSIFCFPIQFY